MSDAEEDRMTEGDALLGDEGGLDSMSETAKMELLERYRREVGEWEKIHAILGQPGWEALMKVFRKRYEQLVSVLADVTEPRILYRTQGELQVIQRLKNIKTECANSVTGLQEAYQLLKSSLAPDAQSGGGKKNG